MQMIVKEFKLQIIKMVKLWKFNSKKSLASPHKCNNHRQNKYKK